MAYYGHNKAIIIEEISVSYTITTKHSIILQYMK